MAKGRVRKTDPATLTHLFDDLVTTRQRLAEKDRKYNPGEHKDKTRSKISLIFVCSYVGLIALVFIVSLIYNQIIILNDKQLNLLLEPKDIVLVITSAIGTSVGFVVGYYFKGEENIGA